MPTARPTRTKVAVAVAALALPLTLMTAGTAAARSSGAAPASPGGESVGDSLFPAIGNTG